jgi:glycosyltransferase involved in cell wall biosynthesis
MALGLTVVALNWGGPGDYLDETCGVLIDPIGRQHAITEMVAAVLASTPDARRALGEAAQRRIAEHYTWPAKVRQIVNVYQSIRAAPDPVLSASGSGALPSDEESETAAPAGELCQQ